MHMYLLWKVEGSDAQGPEAAEHGEKGQTQVVLRDHQREVALAVGITEVINGWVLGMKGISRWKTLQNQTTCRYRVMQKALFVLALSQQITSKLSMWIQV